MIGKTTKGKGFGGVLRYVFQKPETEYIGGNMSGETPNELATEFQTIASQNKKVKIPVAHISFSPSPQEHLDDIQALEFASSYIDKIGFSECQWVLARHNDTKTPEGKERPHFHIIANRVRITDGKVVTAWRDWRRSELAIRALEQEFDLVQVQPSWEHDKSAASRGQTQRVNKEWKELEHFKRDKPPDIPIKVQLQNTIDQAAVDYPRLPQLIERLQDVGVEVKVGYTRTVKVKGISYKQDEITFSGTQLGKAYTFPGLAKYKGVGYDSIRDDDAVKIRLGKIVQSVDQVNLEADLTQASIAQANFEQNLTQASIAQANFEQNLTSSYSQVDDKKSVDDSNSSKQLVLQNSAQEDVQLSEQMAEKLVQQKQVKQKKNKKKNLEYDFE